MSGLPRTEFITETLLQGTETQHPWYALRTKSKCETIAANSLAQKGYDPYLPAYKQRRRWSDRICEVELPLFPGYLFCRFDVQKRLPILMTPGIVSVVGFGKQPLAIPDSEIAAVEGLMQTGLIPQPYPYLSEGQRVRFKQGPLSGVEGVFLKKQKNEWRIIVSVSMLQRSICVEVDRDWIDAAS